MTFSAYYEAVKLVLVNKYQLTEPQAFDVVHRHCGSISDAWEHGGSIENTARELNIRENGFEQYKGGDWELLIAAVRCLSQRLASDGYDTQKILKNNGIDPEKISKLLGGK